MLTRLTDDGPDRIPEIEIDDERADAFMEYLRTEGLKRWQFGYVRSLIAKEMVDEWVELDADKTY